MPDGLSNGDGFSSERTGAPGHLSALLQDLARAPADDLARAWDRPLRPGDAVGRFEILREIGRGGFGVVYQALDRQLGRSVAFKTLRSARSGHELSAGWILKEAEAVARLDHPLGRKDEAFAALEASVAAGYRDAADLGTSRWYQPQRRDQRWTATLRRHGLAP